MESTHTGPEDGECFIKGDGIEDEIDGVKVYPKPMFDFNERRTICMEGMRSAYQAKLYGDDPKVLDGTWRKLFPDSGEGPTEGDNDADAAKADKKIRKEVNIGEGLQGVDEDYGGAADEGGDLRGGDESGNKRKRARKGILDAFVKPSKAGRL